MSAASSVLRKVALLFRRKRFGDDLDEEMAFHRQQAERAMVADGVSADDARYAARRQFGNAARVKDQSHEVVAFSFETVMQDLRFAHRQLRRNPGFALTAVLILALGIGASVAIFAFVDAALIKPLPYPEPTRLVAVNASTGLMPRSSLSYPDFLDWQRMSTVFRSVDVYAAGRMEYNTPSGTESVHGLRVSSGFLTTLGVRPMLGRDFMPGEDAAGASPVVLLRYGAWQNRFGGRADIVGQIINLSGTAYTIIGVLPRDFQFAPREIAEFYAPLRLGTDCEQMRSCRDFDAIGRLKDGVTVTAARAQMQEIAAQLARQYPDSDHGQGASVQLLAPSIVGDIRPILLVLLGGAGLLLLIACVNLSSLMLVRAESRRREIAVRGALGASHGRLSRQFITEALTLVTAGSVLGFALAYAAIKGLGSLISTDWISSMPFLHGLTLSPRVLLFGVCIAVLAGILFSLTPILHFRLSNMRDGLNEGARSSAGRLWRRMGSNLVVIELATALVLLAGAGLLAKSFYRLMHEDLGFRPDHVSAINISLPQDAFSTEAQVIAFEQAVLGRAAALPGVESAAVEDQPPLAGNGVTDSIRIAGRPYDGVHDEVNERIVSVGLFHTLQVPLRRGRFFTEQDTAGKPRVIVVNRAFAEKYFAGQDAVGKEIGDINLTPASMRQIVGVVENFKDGDLDQEQWPAEYEVFAQSPSSYFYFILRTSQAPATLLPTLPAMIHSVSPAVSVDWNRTMQQIVDDSQPASIHRAAAYLVGGFAVLALVLGVVGLYGVIAYSVSQRTREIGVRMALGARRASVYRLVLMQAGRLIGLGVVLGLVGAMGCARLMSSLLFGVQAWDAATLAGVALLLAVCALLASFIPARRAASVNPTEALRAE